MRPAERRGGGNGNGNGGGGGGWHQQPIPGLVQPGEAIFELLGSLNLTERTWPLLDDVLGNAARLIDDGELESGRGMGGGGGGGGGTGADALRGALRLAFASLAPLLPGRPPSVRGYRMYVHYERVQPGGRDGGGGGGYGGGGGGHGGGGGALNGAAGLALEARTLSYWCFVPGVAMHRLLARGVGSVLLTSGTLAPLESMQHEMQVAFGQTLENGHVVPREQVWAGVVAAGPTGVALNASYARRTCPRYLDDLGNAVANFARVVPDGLLVFFPSYAALSAAIEHWRGPGGAAAAGGGGGRAGGGGGGGGSAGGGASAGVFGAGPPSSASAALPSASTDGTTTWERISRHKHPVVEPRDAAAYAPAIAEYRSHVAAAAAGSAAGAASGGVLFAVCRGKSSEGIDFSDRDGRAVIITGIPYAAAGDAAVRIQKQVLDDEVRSGPAGLTAGRGLSGDQWYGQEATRAVNQAMGRVIRHFRDYGAVLLLDERFAAPQTRGKLSKWLRDQVVVQPSFGAAVGSLARFFRERREADAARLAALGGALATKAGVMGALGSGGAPPPRRQGVTALQVVAGAAQAGAQADWGGAAAAALMAAFGGGGGGGGGGLGGGGGGFGVPRAIDLSGFADVADAAAAAEAAAAAAAAAAARPVGAAAAGSKRPLAEGRGGDGGAENAPGAAGSKRAAVSSQASGLEAAMAELDRDARPTIMAVARRGLREGGGGGGSQGGGGGGGSQGAGRRRLLPDVDPVEPAPSRPDPRAALRPEGLFFGVGGSSAAAGGGGSADGGGGGGGGGAEDGAVVGPAGLLAALRQQKQQQQQPRQKQQQQPPERDAPQADGATEGATGARKLRMGDFLRSWNSTQVEEQAEEQRRRQQKERQERERDRGEREERQEREPQRDRPPPAAGGGAQPHEAAAAAAEKRQPNPAPAKRGEADAGTCSGSCPDPRAPQRDAAGSPPEGAGPRGAGRGPSPTPTQPASPQAPAAAAAAAAPSPAAPGPPDPAAFLARLQRELPPEAFERVKALLRAYRERRDAGAFADGAVALLRAPRTVGLLRGLAAFMPPRDRGWFTASIAPHLEAAARAAKRAAGPSGAGGSSGSGGRAAPAAAAAPATLQQEQRQHQQMQQKQHPQPPTLQARSRQELFASHASQVGGARGASAAAGAGGGAAPRLVPPQPQQQRQHNQNPLLQQRPLGVGMSASAALAAAVAAAGGAALLPPPAQPLAHAALPPPARAHVAAAHRSKPCASCGKSPAEAAHRAACCGARSLACFNCWNVALAANPRGCKCFGCGKPVRRGQLSAAFFA